MVEPNKQPVLVVDLGGTKIMAAIILPDGKIESQRYCLTLADEGQEKVINRLVSTVEDMVAESEFIITEIAGVGIAAAGALDARNGIITDSPNLPGWRDVPLRNIIADKLGIATHLINDASAAALGEHRFGSGKGISNLVYITVSTGIGGGTIIEGELYSGADGCAGEIGHMVIKADGPQCNCGNYGCLEILASGTAVAREAIRLINQGENSSIIEVAHGRPEDITAETVALAAKQGDKLASEIVAKAAYYLGVGMVNIVNIFNPEMIVVGGGMSQMGDMLLNPAREVVSQRAFKLPSRTVRIVQARLGNNSGIIGAAIFVLDQLTDRQGEALQY